MGPDLTRAECRTLGKAVKQRWVIPDDVFEKLPTRVAHMALKNRSPRTALAAGRLLVDMSKVNAVVDNPSIAAGGGPQIVVYDRNQGPPDPSRLPSVGEDGERILVAGSPVLLPVKDPVSGDGRIDSPPSAPENAGNRSAVPRHDSPPDRPGGQKRS